MIERASPQAWSPVRSRYVSYVMRFVALPAWLLFLFVSLHLSIADDDANQRFCRMKPSFQRSFSSLSTHVHSSTVEYCNYTSYFNNNKWIVISNTKMRPATNDLKKRMLDYMCFVASGNVDFCISPLSNYPTC